MPGIDDKNETEEDDMEQDTPESDKSEDEDDSDSASGSDDEESSGDISVLFILWKTCIVAHILSIILFVSKLFKVCLVFL